MKNQIILTSYSEKELEEKFKNWLKEAIGPESQKATYSFEKTQRLTRKQVCSHYGIGLSKLHYLMREGKIPFRKEGRKTLFKFEDLENYFGGTKND